MTAPDAAASEAEPVENTANAHIAEQPHTVERWTIDGQAVDDMTLSVQASCEGVEVAAERIEALVGVPGRGAAGIDIVGQNISVAQHATAADALQTVNIGDLIRRGAAAIAGQRADEGAASKAEVDGSKIGQRADLAPGARSQGEDSGVHARRIADDSGGRHPQGVHVQSGVDGKVAGNIQGDIAGINLVVQRKAAGGRQVQCVQAGDQARH